MTDAVASPPRHAGRSLDQRFFEMLRQSESWPQSALFAYQRDRLAKLLEFARANVPFYKTRLEPLFRPDGTIDWSRWAEIPVLRRSHLLDERPAMLAPKLPSEHGAVHDFSSSGSTGLPVTVTVTRLANMVTQCCSFRAQVWHGLDWSKNALTYVGEPQGASWPKGASHGRWGPHWDTTATGEMLGLARSTPSANVLDFIRRRDVHYLFARPRSAQHLALDALRRNERVRLDKLVNFGTATTPDERSDCLAAFGAGMYGSYSSKEAGMMAHDCPAGHGMHINAEAVLLEIVDDNDRLVPPGTPGRILVTSLHNFAQPLIRYDQGDLGVMEEGCSCGRTLPLLARIIGRQTDLFRFPDGQVMSPVVPDELRDLLGAQYWQIAQVAPLAVEVRYVPFPETVPDETSSIELVRRHIRRDLEVTILRCTELERVAGGKFKPYLRELAP